MQPTIPLLNHKNAVLLSEQDVREMGFARVALCLAEILMKPGLNALLASKQPSRLLAIQGGWVADLRGLQYLPAADSFALVSHYDGSKLKISQAQLLHVLQHLEVQALVLPKNGVANFSRFEHIDDTRIELDAFCKAHAGEFWDGQGYADIQNPQYRLDTRILAEDCTCKICRTPFTKSYLHHLYQETPLLAERYLALHNLSARLMR